MSDDEQWMQQALTLARQAEQAGEVPVGAVLVKDGRVIGRGFNQPITLYDPSAHAEVVALRDAGQSLQNYRLPETTLYVTLEPCAMCVGALVHARIKRLVYAASDPRTGAVSSCMSLLTSQCFNHQIEVSAGVLNEQASRLLSDFFKKRRASKA